MFRNFMHSGGDTFKSYNEFIHHHHHPSPQCLGNDIWFWDLFQCLIFCQLVKYSQKLMVTQKLSGAAIHQSDHKLLSLVILDCAFGCSLVSGQDYDLRSQTIVIGANRALLTQAQLHEQGWTPGRDLTQPLRPSSHLTQWIKDLLQTN